MKSIEQLRNKVVLIFGATGNAGSGALEACLASDEVTEVRAIVRKPTEITHPKLKEIIWSDFLNLEPVSDSFHGVDICLFCLGTSVRNTKSEDEYRLIHVSYPIAAARLISRASPAATFVYISGAGTNRKSVMMWARVKGEAEDKLAALNLPRLALVRPGGIVPKQPHGLEQRLLVPFVKLIPSLGITSHENGRAMLQIALDPDWKGTRTFANKDLRKFSKGAFW